MVEKNFGSLQQFAKLYQFIGKQPRNRDEVSDFVMTGMSMKSKNTVRNYTEKVFEGELPFLVVDGDVVNGTMMAGQIAGLIKEEQTCAEMIQDIMAKANELLKGSRFE